MVGRRADLAQHLHRPLRVERRAEGDLPEEVRADVVYHCKFTIWKTEWLKQSMTDDYGASVYCKYRNAKNNPQK